MNEIVRLGDGQAPARFDYSELDAATADKARGVVERYRDRTKAYVIDTGLDLLSIKARLDHGQFHEGVKAEMQMEPRSAQRAMAAADLFASKSVSVTRMPPTALYALSAPSTPALVREQLVQRIEAGEKLSAKQVEKIVHEAREQARREQEEAKLTAEQRKRRAKARGAAPPCPEGEHRIGWDHA